jgi:hypothetical protein
MSGSPSNIYMPGMSMGRVSAPDRVAGIPDLAAQRLGMSADTSAHRIAVHAAMSLIPEWLGVAGAAVFLMIACAHLLHMAHTSGQRRPWHGCHVLIAVGMAFMYAPPAVDQLGVPAAFWRLIFASAGILAALWALGGVGRVATLMWLLTSLDLGAMMYMWSPKSSVAPLTWLLVVYFIIQGGMWALDAYRRLDGGPPIIIWSFMSAAPAGPAITVFGAGAAAESLIGDLDIGVSMITMTFGMAYMFAVMVLMI